MGDPSVAGGECGQGPDHDARRVDETRRRVLQSLFGGCVASLVPFAHAQAATDDAARRTFFALSAILVGGVTLDPALGARLHDALLADVMDHPSTSLTFDADEDMWLGRGPQSPSSINTMRDGAFRGEHAAYRLDFTNISRVDSATNALLAQGVYGPEFAKRLRHSAARELNVKNVLEVLPDPGHRITLAAEKDAMGIPRPQAHYSIPARRSATPSDARTITRTCFAPAPA